MNERVASLVGDLPPVGTKVTYHNTDPSSHWHDMDGVRGTVLRHRTFQFDGDDINSRMRGMSTALRLQAIRSNNGREQCYLIPAFTHHCGLALVTVAGIEPAHPRHAGSPLRSTGMNASGIDAITAT